MNAANSKVPNTQWPATGPKGGELPIPQSWFINLVIGLLGGALWCVFAWRHLLAFNATQQWIYLVVGFSETLTAAFFLIRSAPVTVSTRSSDWLLALGGTFVPLLFLPNTTGVLPEARVLLYVGTLLQIVSLVSLNRSFALVAARRQVKTRGMYRIVRHPLYASHWLVFTGYLLTNTSWSNLVLYLVTMALLSARAVREEAHLREDPAYVAYMQQVRWRIVPGVF